MTTIAMTGASGYIGQCLIKKLGASGRSVIAIKRNQLPDRRSDWPDLPKNSHVVHLAGRTDVLDSWKDPLGYYDANATLTLKLLEKCRESNCSMTYLSSYVYGRPQYLPIDESHPLASVNPYGLSKVAADELVRFYADNFDVKANVLRLFNTYGPHQQDSLLIPTIAKQLMDTEATEIVVKDLEPKRDYIYIDDVIDAIIAVEGKEPGQAFNLGSGTSYSVREIIEGLIAASGRKISYRSDEAERRNEIPDVVAQIDKLKSCTGWKPKVDLYKGLDAVYRLQCGDTK